MNVSVITATADRFKRLLLAGALVCFLAILAGCGQRGPLYLPDEQPEGTPAQEETETESGEEDEETSGT